MTRPDGMRPFLVYLTGKSFQAFHDIGAYKTLLADVLVRPSHLAQRRFVVGIFCRGHIRPRGTLRSPHIHSASQRNGAPFVVAAPFKQYLRSGHEPRLLVADMHQGDEHPGINGTGLEEQLFCIKSLRHGTFYTSGKNQFAERAYLHLGEEIGEIELVIAIWARWLLRHRSQRRRSIGMGARE